MSESPWKPWRTRPRDGTYFIATNGKQILTGNEPKMCTFGNWKKQPRQDSEWKGSFIRLDHPILWMELPPLPEMNSTMINHSWAHNAWLCSLTRLYSYRFQNVPAGDYDCTEYIERVQSLADTCKGLRAMAYPSSRSASY